MHGGRGTALYVLTGQPALAAVPLMLAAAVIGFLSGASRARAFSWGCGQRVSWDYFGRDVLAGRLGEAGFVLDLSDSARRVHR